MAVDPGSPMSAVLSRRTLLGAALAGTALLVTACHTDEPDADAVTADQVDQLAAQVTAQAALVAAYDTAFAASTKLASAAGTLADQAREQLTRLQQAAPGSSSAAPTTAAGPSAAKARSWLHQQVSAAIESHSTACPQFSGARAALLGSIAAGLRGQAAQLA